MRENLLLREDLLQSEVLAEETSEENATPAAAHNAVRRLQRFPVAG